VGRLKQFRHPPLSRTSSVAVVLASTWWVGNVVVSFGSGRQSVNERRVEDIENRTVKMFVMIIGQNNGI
jgi:hypothetical protein